MIKSQTQLNFEDFSVRRPQNRRQRRLRQARWWFDQMRQVVDRAWDRDVDRSGRPEQIYFPLAGKRQGN